MTAERMNSPTHPAAGATVPTRAAKGRGRSRRTRRPNPTRREIARACRAVQAAWTPDERRERCLATSLPLQRQLQQLAEQILPPPPTITNVHRLTDLFRLNRAERGFQPKSIAIR
jgi:hypothetical protein